MVWSKLSAAYWRNSVVRFGMTERHFVHTAVALDRAAESAMMKRVNDESGCEVVTQLHANPKLQWG